ncbi:alcohol dehydrogenase [Acrocarpospora corrugata]|uniref:Alcohol dehydrogenase n=1 Tax=Acrocarpospora corrugata TaxID=35763 RepID=A0A5M3VQK0_9ACTN|nr:zinc-dependent alcohol dehydrogenase family protein [Acrocarpospora corrugata]GER98753.1 alcohol dehydrogenase [Acrocarpospora corrugata]
MRAVVYDGFQQLPEVREVPEPGAPPGGAVIRVEATGLCRSDWHGWQGHDADIQKFPHVPGHEFAGVVTEVGAGVRGWTAGDRVMAPFVCACGTCADCARGDHQVCANQTQPGFTHWGSFAGYVAIDHADVNLIRLPEGMAFATAAGLGCRFATAFRAIVERAAVRPGEWVAVYGCGGVGLSAVMIAAAAGARVIAIDTAPEALALARSFGAAEGLLAGSGDLPGRIAELTSGGAHVSLDALGDPGTCAQSISSLRRRGRHVQIGLLPQGADLPMGRVIGYELDVLGSHGMPAHAYPPMLDLIAADRLHPEALITRTISLDEAVAALTGGSTPGVTMIDPWLQSDA